MAQLSVWTRLWTMAWRLWRLPPLPSLGISFGATSFTLERRAGRSGGVGIGSEGRYAREMLPSSQRLPASSPNRAFSTGSGSFSTRKAASTSISASSLLLSISESRSHPLISLSGCPEIKCMAERRGFFKANKGFALLD